MVTRPAARTPTLESMTTQTFYATGLTCAHCAAAVAEEFKALEGVETADVTPVRDGISTIVITTSREVTRDEAAAALDEAGDYALAVPRGVPDQTGTSA